MPNSLRNVDEIVFRHVGACESLTVAQIAQKCGLAEDKVRNSLTYALCDRVNVFDGKYRRRKVRDRRPMWRR